MVGSGVFQIPLDPTTQILFGVEVRPVAWSAKPNNSMVSTQVTSSFGSEGRCSASD